MRENIQKISAFLADFCLLAIVFSVPIFFSWFFWSFEAFEINKLALFRVLLILGYLAAIANVLSSKKLSLPRARPFFIFSAALAFVFLISAFFAGNHNLSFWGGNSRGQGFYSHFFYLLFFLFLLFRLKNFKQIKQLLSAAGASAFLACLYGIFQLLGWDYITWKEPASETGRIFSSFGQPNFFGHFLVITIPLFVYSLIFQAKKFRSRCGWSVLLLLSLFCLFFTYSRSAWLAFLISALIALVGLLFIFKRKKIAVSIGALAAVAGIFLVFFSFSGSIRESRPDDSYFVKRVLSVFEMSRGSVGVRLGYWQAAAAELKDASPLRLLFGYGPDSLNDVFAKRYEPFWSVNEKVMPDRAHNLFFDIVLQFGLFGLSAWAFFVIYILKKILVFFRASQKDEKFWLLFAILISLSAYSLNNFFSFSASVHFIYFYFLLGLAAFVLGFCQNKKELTVLWPDRLSFLVFLFFLFLGGMMIFYYNVRFVLADVRYREAQETGVCLDSWKKIYEASLLNPFSVLYKSNLLSRSAACLEYSDFGLEGRKFEAETDLLIKRFSKERGGFNFYLSLAAAKGVLGYRGFGNYAFQAEEDYARLEREYPNLNASFQYHAYLEMRLGRYEEAIVILKNGLEVLAPFDWFKEDTEYRTIAKYELIKFFEPLGLAYEKTGQPAQAIAYYEKIIELVPEYLSAYDRLIFVSTEAGDKEKARYYQNKKKEYGQISR